MKGPIRFIIAGSGHIAGRHQPAERRTNISTGPTTTCPPTVEDWQAGATEHPGSWWPDWDGWLAPLSGKKVPARKPGDGKLKVLGDAPGTYVKVKAQ